MTERIDEGGYGRVYLDKKDEKIVVKRHMVDAKLEGFASLRETSIYQHMNVCQTTTNILEVACTSRRLFSPIGHRSLKDDKKVLVMEKADGNLRDYLHNNRTLKTVEYYGQMKRFMVQMLLAFESMHKVGYIHRDVKPENFLIIHNGEHYDLCLTDFGMSIPHGYGPQMYIDIFGSWYRPPEILVGNYNYDFAVDMWAVGLIFLEMINHRNLLVDISDNDRKIFEYYINNLPIDVNEKSPEIIELFKNGKTTFSIKNKKKTIDFRKFLDIEEKNFAVGAGDIDLFIDLVKKLLCYDPKKRITATQALAHPYFKIYQEFIQFYRDCEQPASLEKPFTIHNCFERKAAMKLAKKVFESRKYAEWYNHRMIFQAISLFDRYLSHKLKSVKENKLETKEKGRLWNKKESETRFAYFLYMAYKFFFIHGEAMDLKGLNEVTKIGGLKEEDLYDLEMEVCGLWEYDIYVHTPLEKHCQKNGYEEKKIVSLFEKYIGLGAGTYELNEF